MQKKLYFYILSCLIFFYNVTAYAQFDSGILWQIENASGQKSLLFGTLHLIDKNMDNIYHRIEKKMVGARSINVEYLINHDDANAIYEMLYKTDIKISNRLSSEDFKKLVALTKAYNIPFEAIEYASPSIIGYFLMNPKAISEMPMDTKIMNYALNNGIQLNGLDSAKNTLNIITSLDDTYFMSAIKEIINDPEDFQKNIKISKALYLKENLAEMDKHMRNSISDPKMAEAFYNEALIRRNKIMADNLLAELEQGNAFAAVGMSHLPGEKGMLNLLAQRGYKITRVSL